MLVLVLVIQSRYTYWKRGSAISQKSAMRGVYVPAGAADRAGLAYLPRVVRQSPPGDFVGLMYLPFQLSRYGYNAAPIASTCNGSPRKCQRDDVFVRDPHIHCNLLKSGIMRCAIYFPMGLHFVTINRLSRAWYASAAWRGEPHAQRPV